MNRTGVTIAGLDFAMCLARQQRLRDALCYLNLDLALLAAPGHVHYLTAYWHRTILKRVVLVQRDGPTVLLVPLAPTAAPAADEIIEFESNKYATLVDDQLSVALGMIAARLAKHIRIGTDNGIRPGILEGKQLVDLEPTMLALRRHKDSDEVNLLRQATHASEAAYGWLRENLCEGIDEVELFAGIQAACCRYAGEILGECGNDFQVNSPSGNPRRRPAGKGEIGVFDLSTVLRGYSSDMCRSFVVDGEPSSVQHDAHQRIMEVFDFVETSARAGASCKELFHSAQQRLDGYRGWQFQHHLGHGIGLFAHEAPRLNPYYDDRLEVGDVFTVEPGLYSPELRAGLRIEQIYHVTETGLQRLTNFPTDLARADHL